MGCGRRGRDRGGGPRSGQRATIPGPDLPVLERERGEITVDVASVNFCDSSGITALIKLRRRCDERGWHLRTVNLQPAVRRIVVDFGGLRAYLNVL
jgi:anti-anti-sigma factor